MTSAKVIPPGGEGSVSVTFKTGNYTGIKSKSVTVTSNDPENPRISLTIVANIVVEFALEPPTIYLGRFSKNEEISRTAKIVAKDYDKLKIEKIESSVEQLSAKLVHNETPKGVNPDGQPDSGKPPVDNTSPLSLEITAKPGMKIGRFNEKIIIHTNLEKAPTYEVSVSGEVTGDINADQRVVSFRRGEADAEKTKIVKVASSGTKEFSVTKVESSDPHFSASFDTVTKGKEYSVTVTLIDDSPEQFIRGDIIIYLDDPDQPEIKIPAYASMRKPPDKTTDEQKSMRAPQGSGAKLEPISDKAKAHSSTDSKKDK